MYPSIRPGSVIFIKPIVESGDLVSGEIIAWKRESGFVVHRLIRTEKRGNEIYYISRGDSSKTEDNPLTRDQIAGKVIRIEGPEKKIMEGKRLSRKPCYSANRFIVWLTVQIKRILKLFINKPRGSITIFTFFLIPLCSFVMYLAILDYSSFYFKHKGAQRLSQRCTEFSNYLSVNSFKASGFYESEI